MPAAEGYVGVRAAMGRKGRYGLNVGCLRTGYRRTANRSRRRETETNHEQSQSYFQTPPDEDHQDARPSDDRSLAARVRNLSTSTTPSTRARLPQGA